MLKIHQLFFVNFLGLFILTMLIASFLSFYNIKSIVIHNSTEQLKQNIELITMELEAVDALQPFSERIKAASKVRVTIVSEAGGVLAESDTDKDEMQNHANRLEIMQAATHEYGTAIRYSQTIKMDFLYVAKQVNYKGKVLTLRLSKSLDGIMKSFYTLWSKLALAFSVTIIIALVISYNLSKKVKHDIAQITDYLDKVANKNYKAVIKTRYFIEFLQISIFLKNLVKKLGNREKQKRKYTAKLRLMNKQRTDVLSAISHEFKNPIASIMGYAETLKDDPDASVMIREKFTEKIIANAKKISDMLDRLALSVKLENEDLKIRESEFDIAPLCEEAVANMHKKYPYRKITFEGESQRIRADKTMIELVLVNLIDNALKYSEEEVVIRLENFRLSVTDKGLGIEPSELENITSKFYRVQKNSWDNSMGLGLAIVSYILKQHRCTLHIGSEINVGSTFFFDISPLLIEHVALLES